MFWLSVLLLRNEHMYSFTLFLILSYTIPLSLEINVTIICQNPEKFGKRVKITSCCPRCFTRERMSCLEYVFSVFYGVDFTNKTPNCLRPVGRKRKNWTNLFNSMYMIINNYGKSVLVNFLFLQDSSRFTERFKWKNITPVFSNISNENNVIFRFIVPRGYSMVILMATNTTEQISLLICFKNNSYLHFISDYEYSCTDRIPNNHPRKKFHRIMSNFSNFTAENKVVVLRICISIGNITEQIRNQLTKVFQSQWRNNQLSFNISRVSFNIILNSSTIEMCFGIKNTNFSLTKLCLLRNRSIRNTKPFAHRFDVTQLEYLTFSGNDSNTTLADSFNFTTKELIKSHCNSLVTKNINIKRIQQTLKKKSMKNYDYHGSLLSRKKRELLRYRGHLVHDISSKVRRQNISEILIKRSSLNSMSRKRKFNQSKGHSEKILDMYNETLNMCKQGVNCKLPTCWCFGKKPGFDGRNIPQLVYFTFDGIVDKTAREKIAHLFSHDRTNENSCHIRATIFITGLASDYKEINWLYRAGHEIALNGLSNDIVDPLMEPLEIAVQKKLLERYAGIPDLYVTGWRNSREPLKWNKQLHYLKKYKMEYDSSLIIRPSNVGKRGIWPFTLEFGWGENCKNSSCSLKMKKLEGLWEIPSILYSDFESSKLCYYIDDCFNKPHTSVETYDYLVRNFLNAHKSKMPFGVRLRKNWFDKENKQSFRGLDAFIRFLLELDNVYLISISDLVGWMRHPQPIFTEKHIKNFLGIGC